MMHMEHRQTQQQTQTQQLVLTQKMQQALHILQMSGMELEHYVQQELETNPFLEQVQKKTDPLTEVPEQPSTKSDNEVFEENFDLDAYADKWDLRRREGRDLSYNPDLFARRQYYEDSITQDESFRAHLLAQLRYVAEEDDPAYAIGERILIGDIDERGYFTGDPQAIADELGVPAEQVEAMLRTIQAFEPTGVGARDVVECLLLQITAEHPDNEELKTLVRDHLEALKRRQIPKIARDMRIPPRPRRGTRAPARHAQSLARPRIRLRAPAICRT